MSEGHIAKQARANVAGDAHVRQDAPTPAFDLETMRLCIDQLDREELASILLQATQAHPDVGEMVNSVIEEIRAKESRRVINFDYYSKSIWKALNKTYASMSGSKQCEIAGDVVNGIRADVKSIVKQCGPLASFDTQWNGLSVLRKIGKTVTLADDTLGAEVRLIFQWEPCIEEGMMKIISAMTWEEREYIRTDDESPDAFRPKLVELKQLAARYGVLEKLGEVVAMLDAVEEFDSYHEADEDEEDHADFHENDDAYRYPESDSC